MIPVQAFGDKLIIDVYLPIEDQQVVNGYAAPPKDGKLARSESGTVGKLASLNPFSTATVLLVGYWSPFTHTLIYT